MDLRQMRYVVKVAERGTMRAAAKSLHIAPQSLAQQVALAEREAGVPLFHRSSAGMTLTPAGEVFIAHAAAALNQAELVLTATRAAAGQLIPELVRVGTAPGLPAVVDELFRRAFLLYPDLEISATGLRSTQQLDLLRSGELTAGIVYGNAGHGAPHGLVVQLLYDSPVHALLRRDDPLAAGESVSLSDLARVPLLPPPEEAQFLRQHVLDAFAARNLNPRQGATVHGHDIAAAAVAAGRGYALCVLPTTHVNEDLVFIPIREPITPIQVLLLTRHTDRTAGAMALRHAARRLVARAPSAQPGTAI